MILIKNEVVTALAVPSSSLLISESANWRMARLTHDTRPAKMLLQWPPASRRLLLLLLHRTLLASSGGLVLDQDHLHYRAFRQPSLLCRPELVAGWQLWMLIFTPYSVKSITICDTSLGSTEGV